MLVKNKIDLVLFFNITNYLDRNTIEVHHIIFYEIAVKIKSTI